MAESGNTRPRPAVRSVSAQRPATPPILSTTPPSSSRSTVLSPASSGGHQASKTTNSHVSYEKGKPNRDVGKLVDAYRKIQMLSWPLVLSYEFTSAIFSWEYPILTVGIWIGLQLFSLYMTTGQLLVVCFLMLFVIASLGYLSYTSQQLTERHHSSKKHNFGSRLSANSSSSSLSSSSSSSMLPSTASQVQGSSSCTTNQKVTKAGDSHKVKNSLSSSPPKTASSSSSSSLPTGDGCSATSHHDKNDKHAELEIDSQRRRELLAEYRQMMEDLSRWLTTVSKLLVWMEDILLWRCRWKTILFYLALYTSVLCIIYVPFHWITMATTNCLLVTHPQCSVGLGKMKRWITSKMSKDSEKDVSSNHLDNSQGKEPADSHLQKDGIVSSHPLSEDTKQWGIKKADVKERLWRGGSKTLDETFDKVNGNDDTDEEMQGDKRIKATQISVPSSRVVDGSATSQQQQQPQQHQQPKKFDSGMCYLCGTLFTSVLKRRRYCRYCGRDFCPKCCSKKLPRSALGATAPAAQTEKELVCNLCIIKLTGEEVGSSRIR